MRPILAGASVVEGSGISSASSAAAAAAPHADDPALISAGSRIQDEIALTNSLRCSCCCCRDDRTTPSAAESLELDASTAANSPPRRLQQTRARLEEDIGSNFPLFSNDEALEQFDNPELLLRGRARGAKPSAEAQWKEEEVGDEIGCTFATATAHWHCQTDDMSSCFRWTSFPALGRVWGFYMEGPALNKDRPLIRITQLTRRMAVGHR